MGEAFGTASTQRYGRAGGFGVDQLGHFVHIGFGLDDVVVAGQADV